MSRLMGPVRNSARTNAKSCPGGKKPMGWYTEILPKWSDPVKHYQDAQIRIWSISPETKSIMRTEELRAAVEQVVPICYAASRHERF